jgi:Amino acid synthesis
MSDLLKLRKFVATVEETFHDGGPRLDRPVTKACVGGVIANPYAGRHVADIQPMMKALEPLAIDLTERVMKLLGAKGPELEAYGKGVIVGIAGELEHAALWHQPSGFGIRHAIHSDGSGGAKSIVPSTVKVAAAGARIDIPLHHVTASYVRSHFDSIEFCVPDGPRPDEIVFIVAASIGGRPHARVGGLTAAEIKVGDGQR